jgi:hypothetical protein
LRSVCSPIPISRNAYRVSIKPHSSENSSPTLLTIMQQTTLIANEPSALPQPLISYFDAVNDRSNFSAANLFCKEGILVAPLGVQVRGRAAITAYLEDKCEGMTLYPEQVSSIDASTIVVLGHVKCPAFTVQVEWKFHMIRTEIAVLQVRLLASLQQLTHLRHSKYAI